MLSVPCVKLINVSLYLNKNSSPNSKDNLIQDEIIDTFVSMGYEVKEGPDVESDYYNFERMNIPARHTGEIPAPTVSSIS